MPQSKEQKETVARVMHEFRHGELESVTGTPVENPRQAIAIALREAGASKYEDEAGNQENLRRTKEREREGRTARQREGRTARQRDEG